MKKHKSSEPGEASKSKNAAELFVLPPELLVKLGIDLGNSSNSDLAEGSDQNNAHNNPNSLPESRDTSSIIETANLMKESVLLSPTFLQTASNVTLEEEGTFFINESVPTTDTIPNKSGNVLYSNNTDTESTTICDESAPELLNAYSELIKIKSNHEIPLKQLDSFHSHKSVEEYQVENQDGNLILTDVSYQNTRDDKISNDKSKTTYPLDEHPDEAYLSDSSNNYSGLSPERICTEFEKQGSINEITEDVGETNKDHAQLKHVENVCLTDHDILPLIIVNTVATGTEFQSDSYIDIKDNKSDTIAPKQFMIEEPLIMSGNSETEIQTLDNVILWTPVDQIEKDISSTKIEFYDSHNNSIIQINASLDAKKSSDETVVVLANSDCAQGLESSESVSECSDMKLNGSEKFSEENDEYLSIVQRNIKYNIKNKEINLSKNEKIPEYNEKIDYENNKMRNLSNEMTVDNSKEEENMMLQTKNYTQDKVEEIAAYLSEIVNERNKTLRNHYKNKEKHILSKSKVDPIKSKLCAKGAEKPSGNPNQKDKVGCSKVLKTYQRAATQKRIPGLITIPDQILTSDPFQLSNNHDSEKLDIKVGNLRDRNDFCICFDFGNLAYYDCEMLYEHIHFWHHKNVKCDSEILYSIYNDDYTVSKKVVVFIEDGDQNAPHENETSEDNICWNDIKSNNNYANIENLAILSTARDSSIPEKASSSSVQEPLEEVVRKTSLSFSEMLIDQEDNVADNIAKRVRNRKRSSVTTDQESEANDPVAKKIKCGVCNQLMLDLEWKAHKEIEHNSVAWKADQDIKTSGSTTTEPTIYTRSTRRSTRNSTNSEIDLLSSRKDSDSEINVSPNIDILVTENSTSKETDVTTRSSRRTSKTEIDFTSKSTKECTEVQSDRLSKNKTDILESSKDSQITSNIEKKNMLVRSIRSSKIDMPSKLIEKSADAAKDDISSSMKYKSKSANIESSTPTNTSLKRIDTGASDSLVSSRKTVNVEVEFDLPSRSSRKSVSNKGVDESNSQKKTIEETLSPKSKRMISKTELTETTESTEIITNIDRVTSNLAAGTEISNEFQRTTRRSSKIKNDDTDLLKNSTDTEQTCNLKVNKAIDKNKIKTQKAAVVNTESTLKSSSSSGNTKIVEASRRKSSKTAVVPSSLSTKTIEDIESGHISESTPKHINMQTDDKSSPKTTKRVESDIQTVSHSKRKHLNTKPFKKRVTDFIINTETTSNETEKPLRTTSKQIIIEDPSNSSTKNLCNDKLSKTGKPITSSILSRESTNQEFSEFPKSMKRCLNTVNVNTPAKKLKTMDNGNQSIPTDRSAKISNNDTYNTSKVLESLLDTETITKRNEQTKTTANSSNIEVVNKLVSKQHSTNDDVDETTAINKSTKVDAVTISRNTDDPSKSKRKNSNTKIAKSKPADTENELHLNYTEPCTSKLVQEQKDTPHLDMAIVDLTITRDSQSSQNYSTYKIEIEVPAQIPDNSTRCGVCKEIVANVLWIEHIFKEHDYLAWRHSDHVLNLNNPNEVKQHLQVIAKENNGLVCSKCGLVRKCAQPYLRHIRSCNGEKGSANISTVSVDLESTKDQGDDTPLSAVKSKKSRGKRKFAVLLPITCGVCSKTVEQPEWIEHIRVEHNYMAWRDDETPLNLDDEDEVKKHLNYISKFHGGLFCSKCGSKWNYVKKYLLHEKICGSQINQIMVDATKSLKIEVESRPVVTCGVCKLDVEGKNWITHIQRTHEYMAWIDGDTPLNVDDPVQVKDHLTRVVAVAGELVCMQCGLSRKHARAYMLHIKACTNSGFQMEAAPALVVDKDKYECGICHETGNRKEWKDHAMMKHYNIAWMVGELPINVRNPYAVEKYLKEYQKKHNLICKNCKATRASCYGFYAHIMTCGKTEEELEAVHNVCDICNNKYLCIYRNQHIAMHREQVYKKELKAKLAAEEADNTVEPEREKDQPMGKRRAAQKAKKVIENYTSKANDGMTCSCGATFENAEEKSQHKCDQPQRVEDDDSDVSIKMEAESEDESLDSDIDSNVSDDEEAAQMKRKRQRIGEGSTKIARMSYRVNNYMSYLVQAYRDFCNLHYTSENLFNDWRNSEFEVVPADEMPKYLPSLAESCKVRFSDVDSEWITYKRFESKKVKGYSIFAGGSVQCMAWAPHNVADETLGNYLAVAAHRAADAPRLPPRARAAHPALLQIWDFQQFNFLPRCALSLALEFGTVWGAAWCPSGARDRVPPAWRGSLAAFRLGLLAVACSDGIAYIFAVPCPPAQTDNEHVMYKMKPVAELKIAMTAERPVYQATTINWSQQKGHNIIIVGYSDGTTALYDLNTESPFLKETKDNVTTFYPFQDKLSENSPITGVAICPTANESYSIGGFCSSSATGATMSGWPAAAPSVRLHLASAGVSYCPQWPAAVLSGDSLLTVKTVNEMEWWGGGRRLGACRGAAACARCGRAVAAAAPAVRLLRAHVCYPEIKKQIVATLLMVPFGPKRKHIVDDDLSIVVEPLTYEDAIAKYGLELAIVPKNEQAAAQKLCSKNELFPDRFPLSDIVAAAFCPSARFHEKITLATHAGIIFVINV